MFLHIVHITVFLLVLDDCPNYVKLTRMWDSSKWNFKRLNRIVEWFFLCWLLKSKCAYNENEWTLMMVVIMMMVLNSIALLSSTMNMLDRVHCTLYCTVYTIHWLQNPKSNHFSRCCVRSAHRLSEMCEDSENLVLFTFESMRNCTHLAIECGNFSHNY